MTVSSVKTGAVGISFALDNNYMEPIATTLVGSGGVNQITFNDIPQTYKHLQIRGIGRSTTGGSGADDLYMRINSDYGANYANHSLYGDGTSAGSSAATNGSYIRFAALLMRVSQTANLFGSAIIDILDYTNSNKNKTIRALVGEDRNGAGQVQLISGLWINTTSISSITFYPEANSFAQYSRFSLYGIKG
jgi:hypothetical protein